MFAPVALQEHLDADYPFADAPLVVAYAAVDGLERVRAGARVALAATPERSPDDGYLLLPARAHDALEAAFACGQLGRLRAWMDEAVVVEGDLEATRHGTRLVVSRGWRAREVLERAQPRTVAMRSVGDPLRIVNALPPIAGLCAADLFDHDGAELARRAREYVGAARASGAALAQHDGAARTYVWTARDPDGDVRVQLALGVDDDAVTAALAPVTLRG